MVTDSIGAVSVMLDTEGNNGDEGCEGMVDVDESDGANDNGLVRSDDDDERGGCERCPRCVVTGRCSGS